MSNFFKTIIRGVMQSNHNLNKPNKFMGNLINNMAEITATATVNDQKTYFAEPLAGNLSCFYKTTDDCPNSGEENSDINRKTEQSPQVEKCSVPFMVIKFLIQLFNMLCF